MGQTAEQLARAAGFALSPLTWAIARMRRGRMFHPDGLMFRAVVEPCPERPELELVAHRLAGPALARLSSAFWRNEVERPDDLGVALRLRRSDVLSPEPAPDDQDLLFSSMKHMLLMVAVLVTTDVHDYFGNDYNGVEPFEVDGLGKVKLRLTSTRPATEGRTRLERLQFAVRTGSAVFVLEAKPLDGGRDYEPVCKVKLLEQVDLDQSKLRLSPFRTGRGVHPSGWVHQLRVGAYYGSQKARS
jgi:hypothetical protein